VQLDEIVLHRTRDAPGTMEVPASHSVLVRRVETLRDVRDKDLRVSRWQDLSCESDDRLLDAGGDRLIEQLDIANIEA